MTNSRSAEQIRQQNMQRMGEELGELYSALWQQLTWLHRKWGDYVALFGTKPERLAILNSVAPDFFGTVQTALWEDALLHLARITDSPRSAGKPNLTFRRLPEAINRETLRVQVQDLLDKALVATNFARDWRNRRIAHRDLSLALARPTEPLMTASRAGVNEALTSLNDVLNAVSQSYLDSTTMFEFAQDSVAGGATSMLYYLRAGHKTEQERRERVRAGSFTPSDLDRDPI